MIAVQVKPIFLMSLLHTLNNPNVNTDSNSDSFGSAIAMDAEFIAIAAVSEKSGGSLSSGAIYVFNVTTGALVHTFINPNYTSSPLYDHFGTKLAISGQRIAAHANEDDGAQNTGIVYVFTAPLV
jgi:hypothetical protein